eukprot:scaffold106832_cov68-Phaeocystis_antarctica.AAC.2
MSMRSIHSTVSYFLGLQGIKTGEGMRKTQKLCKAPTSPRVPANAARQMNATREDCDRKKCVHRVARGH